MFRFFSSSSITPDFLRTYRKHAIVIVLIVAAAITPPDIISQIIVTIPIIFLYELSILIAKLVYKEEIGRKEGRIIKKKV
jgi:sec-independent protein translocase protein TatC